MDRNDRAKIVFGLDIGTRSVVGTVGYKEHDKFVILCQKTLEHETRSMIDGQIHDIAAVSETIRKVHTMCEQTVGTKLSEVCIAAAGRVLRTVNTHVDMVFSSNRETMPEDVSNMLSVGVEKAYREFSENEDSDTKFYCVGYSVVKYYLNKLPMNSLVGHKAKQIGADIIATFLPDEVVDGLYKSVELAGLRVANLTLEPIAAISVAIPEKFRMLNIGLVDVGAGTSDISITNDGSIVAYGMIPMAGDAMTDEICKHCLVDFDMAERIKRDSDNLDVIEYEDIMGIPQTISKKEIIDVVNPIIEDEVSRVSDEIIRLNGGKPVSAVFIVGGGGIITGYTDALADKLSIRKERVALRGSEVMGKIDFKDNIDSKKSLLVTPIGICLNYFENSNNLIYVSFNGNRIKLYDNGKVSVVDVAMQAQFPNDGLFPKRGKALTFSVNGKSHITKGEIGEAAVITVNGEPADITTLVKSNDKIVIKESTAGVRARVRVDSLAEYKKKLRLGFDNHSILVNRLVSANGKPVSADYEIEQDDRIEVLDYVFADDVLRALELPLDTPVLANGNPCDSKTRIYENFNIECPNGFTFGVYDEDKSSDEPDERDFFNSEATTEINESVELNESADDNEKINANESVELNESVDDNETINANESVEVNESADAEVMKTANAATDMKSEFGDEKSITIRVNGDLVTLSGKSEYVFVDVFDYIDFDLSNPKGKGIETIHNGKPAMYMNALNDGDDLKIYWKV